jgi:tetratricopeptide (TPR) repeat protein
VFKYRRAAEKRIAKARSVHMIQIKDDTDSILMSREPSSTTVTSLPTIESDEDEGQNSFPDLRNTTCDESGLCSHRHCIQAFFRQLQVHYTSNSGPRPDMSKPLPLDSPLRVGNVEKVLYYVRQFSQSRMAPEPNSHPHHIANAAAKAAQITSGIVGHCSHRSSPKQCERCSWAEFDFGLAMLEDQYTDLALTSFELGCRLAHLLLSSPSKLFIRNLIMAFGSVRWEQFEPFRGKLLEYLAVMASVVLGDKHPITIILENVACGDTLAASAEFALRIMLELFEQKTHAAHPDVLLIKRSLSVILRRQREYDISEEILLGAIQDSESYNGHDCKETRRCLRRLGHLYMEQGRYNEAEAVFQRILDTAPGKTTYQNAWIPDEISVYTYQHLARMANEMGDRSKCRFWFMRELDGAIKRWGVGSDYSAECLQLAYNELPPDSLRSAINQYPDILGQAEMLSVKGGIVISKARWCAVRNLI